MSEDEKKLAAEREDMRAKLVARRERDEMRTARTLPDVSFTATLAGYIHEPTPDDRRADACEDFTNSVRNTLGGAITYPGTHANPDVPQPECTLESLREGIEAVDRFRSAGGMGIDLSHWFEKPTRDEIARRIVELLPTYAPAAARLDLAPGSMLSVFADVCAQSFAEYHERLEMRLAAACQLPRSVLFPEGDFTFRLDGAIEHVEIAPLPRYEP